MYGCKDLTLQFVEDALDQDIPTSVLIWDNGSTDDTISSLEALHDPRISIVSSPTNIGVGPAWNQICGLLFGGILGPVADHVLLCNNDIRLRPDTYRNLLVPTGGFVTAVNVSTMERMWEHDAEKYPVPADPLVKGGPDFSCFVLKKWFYMEVGPFPECFMAYREDNLFHWKVRQLGRDAQIYSVAFPYVHIGSQTIRASAEVAALNSKMWDFNGKLYERITGGPVGAEKYFNNDLAMRPWQEWLSEV